MALPRDKNLMEIMKINKRLFLIILFLSFSLFLTGCGQKPKPVEEKKEAVPEKETFHQLSLEEKPFVGLTPRVDGRELTLDILGAGGYDTVEYEIVYFSKDRQLGLVGEFEMQRKFSATKTGLTLGSCSRGVCTYDSDVNRGNLTLRLRGDNPTKLRSTFRLEQIFGGGEITSIDEKVTVNFSRGNFYVILMDPIGLPNGEKPEGEIIAGPYSLLSSANLGSFKVKFSDEGQILGWNGQKEAWEEIKTGEATTLTTFILVRE